ncbi:MAG: UDP-N-acetylglucosamine 2-epimerase (non-hydrolyzing) [Planctomycetes bacterium]|nr:UDP-N-acetylglucosamine 2-epimerase (non-hydrolyzing) [Planctomycetota bacterium]
MCASSHAAVPNTHRILSVIGTRPEAIKMAPVVHALDAAPWAESRVLTTGQHRDMVDDQLAFFGVTTDLALDVMKPGQDLTSLTAAILPALDDALRSVQPALVLAQGDTTTVLAAALACYYRRVPFGHVEAGLRTGDLTAPFPEEANRVVADRLAALAFAPTERAEQQLRSEGRTEGVYVTGNTVVDALVWTRARLPRSEGDPQARRRLLVTTHRRESVGDGIRGILEATAQLAARGDVEVLLPVHPNPAVAAAVRERLAGVDGVTLTPPLSYPEMVLQLDRCHIVLTDSGGVQEEAPSLGKPVLVLRDVTERVEGVEAGTAKLVGTAPRAIVDAANALLDDDDAYAAMAKISNPYGDGAAAPRIVARCRSFLDAQPLQA